MVALPTIEVTQAQADRVLAAYGSVANYRAWLRRGVVDYVVQFEMEAFRASQQQAGIDKQAQIQSEMA